MKRVKTAVVMVLFFAAMTAPVRSDGIKSTTSWRWTTWTPETGVAPLRWGAPRGETPAYIMRDEQTSGTLAPPIRPAGPSRPASPPLYVAPVSTFQPRVPPQASTPPAATAAPATAPVVIPLSQWSLRPEVVASARASVAFDAVINLGDGPFSQEYPLTAGNAQPWYTSSVASRVFEGTPSAEQRQDFSRAVLQRVESAFERSGIEVSLSDQPGAAAAHTLSVVAGTQSPANPGEVGITDVGRNGFTFIDKLSYANTVDELKTAVANNVAHELMHAFGVERHDLSGGYLDSAVADWSTIISSSASFSDQAIGELMARDFQNVGTSSILGAQAMGHGIDCPDCASTQVVAAPVPEPATWLAWTLLLIAGGNFFRKRRRPRSFASAA